jgi:hypothetical protein
VAQVAEPFPALVAAVASVNDLPVISQWMSSHYPKKVAEGEPPKTLGSGGAAMVSSAQGFGCMGITVRDLRF